MSQPIHILDNYYLSLTLLVTIAYQLFFFAIAFSLKFDKLTDFAGGTNFVLLAILTLALSSPANTRQLVASLFLAAWGLRLSGFLLFRILKTGTDSRFDDKRDHFFRFLGFWVFQMLWVWICSLPVTVLNSPAVQAFPQPAFGTGRDVAGVVLYAVGLVVETVSDAQRYRFRTRNDRSAVCDGGLFYVSRHPNYFGEIVVQFGAYLSPPSDSMRLTTPPAIFIIAVTPTASGSVTGGAYAALYATILGPFFITFLLMFISGLPLSERPGSKKRYEAGTNWDAYARYLNRTSILIPFPPQLYERVPTVLKRTVFLEFPMYVFDPAKHAGGGRAAEEEAGRGQSGEGLVGDDGQA